MTHTSEMVGPGPRSGPPGGPESGEESARAALARLRAEIGKVIVGQDATVTGLVLALLCRGHVLLEGVPGVAKTLKCGECGTLNRPTEWYCERCGAELAGI